MGSGDAVASIGLIATLLFSDAAPADCFAPVSFIPTNGFCSTVFPRSRSMNSLH
jgi:hypothetical protein